MKTSELTGAALDWAVAKCEGYDCLFDDDVSGPWLVPQEGYLHDEKPLGNMRCSTKWSQGGPIIEREKICPDYLLNGQWLAISRTTDAQGYGPTPLIAAMRCYVASKLGDNIEVPKELV